MFDPLQCFYGLQPSSTVAFPLHWPSFTFLTLLELSIYLKYNSIKSIRVSVIDSVRFQIPHAEQKLHNRYQPSKSETRPHDPQAEKMQCSIAELATRIHSWKARFYIPSACRVLVGRNRSFLIASAQRIKSVTEDWSQWVKTSFRNRPLRSVYTVNTVFCDLMRNVNKGKRSPGKLKTTESRKTERTVYKTAILVVRDHAWKLSFSEACQTDHKESQALKIDF